MITFLWYTKFMGNFVSKCGGDTSTRTKEWKVLLNLVFKKETRYLADGCVPIIAVIGSCLGRRRSGWTGSLDANRMELKFQNISQWSELITGYCRSSHQGQNSVPARCSLETARSAHTRGLAKGTNPATIRVANTAQTKGIIARTIPL